MSNQDLVRTQKARNKLQILLYGMVTWACILSSRQALTQSAPPDIKLDAALARIFSVSHCEWISGITCKISYNGKKPLPSEVFFTELDAKGKVLGPRTRLIYPHLIADETGYATFRIRTAEPASLVLSAKWSSSWRNPY